MPVCEHGVEIMPKPWTSHLIRDALGVKKCNGSMETATEDLPLEKAIEVAKKKHAEGHLTGADLKNKHAKLLEPQSQCESRSTVIGRMEALAIINVKEIGTSALFE